MTATARVSDRGHDHHLDRTPRNRGADGQVLGAMLVLAGVAWLVERAGWVDLSWETVLSVLLITLGAGLVVTARRRGGTGLIMIGVLLAVVLASTSSIDVGLMQKGIGNRSFEPATLSEARTHTSLGVGSLHVDLRAVREDLSPDETTIKYQMGVGDLRIVVPADVLVAVDAQVRGGDISVLGQERSGPDLKVPYEDPGYATNTDLPKLRLDLSLGFGHIQVERAPL